MFLRMAHVLWFLALAVASLPHCSSLPPSFPVSDIEFHGACTTLQLWDSANSTCAPTTLCDAGNACTCPGPASSDFDLKRGAKLCRLGTFCACPAGGADGSRPVAEGTCTALKDPGASCTSADECRYGVCAQKGVGAEGFVCSPRGSIVCGQGGVQCGDGMYCEGNTSCQVRKGPQAACAESHECRGGLMCMEGQPGGGKSCLPLFGKGWNEPCTRTWGECAWGMRCEAERCSIVNSNEVVDCTEHSDAACGPYARCMCSESLSSGRGALAGSHGQCVRVVNTECEGPFEQLVRCLARNNCPLHDANFTALSDRPSLCVANRCAAEWGVAQCCKVKGFEGLFQRGDSSLLKAECANGVPTSAGIVIMVMVLISCSSASLLAKRRFGGAGGGYVRVPAEEWEDEADSEGYSMLMGVNEQQFNSGRGAELIASSSARRSKSHIRSIEPMPPYMGDFSEGMDGESGAGDAGEATNEGGGREASPPFFVQGQAGTFSDL
mmetsp:Transcript_1160/g.2967  ORF Transcript_1160/g.2967 Transcript_1160/m.2967 type:complete len:495 (-) Transcript_1160:22-1506(-)